MQMLYDSSPDNAREVSPDEIQVQDRFERAGARVRIGKEWLAGRIVHSSFVEMLHSPRVV
jgi:hypothetical protein